MNAPAHSSIILSPDENISAGLSHDSYETMQLSAAFWEIVWPKLEECGWEKKVFIYATILKIIMQSISSNLQLTLVLRIIYLLLRL